MDRIDHIAIVVKDVRTAADWYASRFECTVEWCDDSWALIACENCALALVTPGQHPQHFAILTDEIEQYGVPTPHRDGTRSVYRRDPDGNVFEMLERPDL